MPTTTLQDLRNRDRANQPRRQPQRRNEANISNNNSTNLISYIAVIGGVLYMLYQFGFSSYIATSTRTNCIRNGTNTEEWMNDWNVINEWNGFVKDCSRNAPHSIDDINMPGFEPDKNINFLEITRCATTAYALINYLCASDTIASSVRSMFRSLQNELSAEFTKEIVLDSLIEIINSVDPSYQTIFRLYLNQNFDSDKISHVWVLQTLSNNTYHWYQSFVSSYTLHNWMEKQKEKNIFLSKQMLFERLELIRNIITTSQWNEKTNNEYLKLFDVDYGHMIGKQISPSIFGEGSGFDNTIHFDYSIECQLNCYKDSFCF